MKLVTSFKDYIITNQREFEYDRTKTLGASEAFGCLRKAWYAKFAPDQAAPHDAHGYMERGNIIENNFMVPAMQHTYGVSKCMYMGAGQRTLRDGLLSATPDGLVVRQPSDVLKEEGLDDLESDCFGSEFKSFDYRTVITEEKQIHMGQAIIQLGMFQRETKFNPQWSLLVYTNCSNLLDMEAYLIKYNEKTYQRAKDRADQLFSTTDPYDIEPEGTWSGQCDLCAFNTICKDAELSRFPDGGGDLSEQDMAKLGKLVDEHDDGRKVAAAQTETKKKAASDIKRLMAEVDVRVVDEPGFKVTYSQCGGRQAFDKEALQNFLVSNGKTMEDFMARGNDYTRLTVTKR